MVDAVILEKVGGFQKGKGGFAAQRSKKANQNAFGMQRSKKANQNAFGMQKGKKAKSKIPAVFNKSRDRSF